MIKNTWKKIAYGVIAVAVVTVGTLSMVSTNNSNMAEATAQTANSTSLLTKAGNAGGPSIARFQLIPKELRETTLALFPASLGFFDTSFNLIFRQYGLSIMENVTLERSGSFDSLFVGFGSPLDPAPPAKLQVDGIINIESLADATKTSAEPVCVNDFGKFERCSVVDPLDPLDPTLTYAWEEGGFGACSGSTGSCSGSWDTTSAGSCSGTYQTQSITNKVNWDGNPLNWNFNQEYPTGFSECRIYKVTSCNSSSCDWRYDRYEFDAYGFDGGVGASGYDPTCGYEAGRPPLSTNNTDGPAATVSSNNVSCTGLAQQDCPSQALGNSSCTWSPAGTTTNSCSGATTSSSCTSQAQECLWDTTGGTQTQTVVCKDSNGVTVADSFCPPPKPSTSQSCPGGGLITPIGGGGTPVGGGTPDGNWFVCGADGNWKMGPSANSTLTASTSNYSSATACGPGATAPINYDSGISGGQDFQNADMRCWNAVPSNCSCFSTPITQNQVC